MVPYSITLNVIRESIVGNVTNPLRYDLDKLRSSLVILPAVTPHRNQQKSFDCQGQNFRR